MNRLLTILWTILVLPITASGSEQSSAAAHKLAKVAKNNNVISQETYGQLPSQHVNLFFSSESISTAPAITSAAALHGETDAASSSTGAHETVDCRAGKETIPDFIRIGKAQYGVVEETNEHLQEPHKLDAVTLISKVGSPNIKIEIDVADLWPKTGPVDTTFRVLVNADADYRTGRTVAGFLGIDKEVMIHVIGNAPTKPKIVSAIVIDDDAGGRQTLLPTIPQLVQDFLSYSSCSTCLSHVSSGVLANKGAITMEMPKSSLNFSAAEVPVAIVAENADGKVVDSLKMVFDREYYLKQATVALFPDKVKAGDSVHFFIWGFSPGASFDLSLLYHNPMLTGKLNEAGRCNGDFSADVPPGDVGGGNYYVQVVVRKQDEAAQTFLTITPRK